MANAASSCEDVANADCNAQSGMYFIRDSQSGVAQQWFCDLEMAGGGWLLMFERLSKCCFAILF